MPRRLVVLGLALALAVGVGVVGVVGVVADAREPRPVAGAAGIGDPYFPLDGNGGIDVLRYDVHDRYRFTGRLSGWTRVTLRTTQALRSFDLDFLLPVSSVVLSTGPASFDRPQAHELRIRPQHPLAAGQTLRVTVRYAGRPADHSYAGESNWMASPTEVEAVNEPHMAPWWFPSDDHPLDKALFDLHLTVPGWAEVVSGGRLAGVRRTGTLATYHWEGAGRLATYLAFFVAGQFEVRTGTSHGLPYYLAVSRDLGAADRRSALAGLRETPGIVHWLVSQLGPYPFTSTGGVVTALDPGFALEDQTRPVYPVAVSRLLMVHELAHQWFGDSVSVHHWADIWLNEGFATYMEHRWTQTHGGESTSRWLRRAVRAEPAASSFWDLDVADPGRAQVFAWPVYQRGAMTLAALRVRIGGQRFDRLLRLWAADRQGGNGTTAQFEALAQRVGGRSLDAFFSTWLRQRARPAWTAADGL